METTAGFTSSSYAQNTGYLNQAINKLRECGCEAMLGEMPKIAVIGNQSAGKSSLIEAMSGIRVPRAVGTCTRCPMEVVLSKVDGVAWTCQISLRFTHDANGVKLPGEPKILSFGDTMTDFRAVEERLKRAQSALLQLPLASDDDVTPFLADDYVPPIKPQVDFSRNVVRLDVSGKDLVNVTFIDLPGIISNAAETAVDTVANMVRSYIEAPDCLILVAISMADDIENQGAARLARRCDAAGKRTIGVLTKADMVTDVELYQRWASIVNGSEPQHHLAHGYYITMQHRPQPDSTWQQILESETTFFINTSSWSTLVPPSRLGCLPLRKKLSEELCDLIRERLPVLIRQINFYKRDIKNQLDKLPRTSAILHAAPHIHLSQICQGLCDRIESAVGGKDDETGLTAAIRLADKQLKTSVISSIAIFGLADHDEKMEGRVTKSANDLLMQRPLPSRQTPRLVPPPKFTTPTTHQAHSDDDCVDITPTRTSISSTIHQRSRAMAYQQKPRSVEPTSPQTDDPNAITFTGEEIELEELRKMIARAQGRKLPGVSCDTLREDLIERSMKPWEECAINYFKEVRKAVCFSLSNMCKETFGRYKRSGLSTLVDEIVLQAVNEITRKTNDALADQWEMESRHYTLNEELYTHLAEKLQTDIISYRAMESPGAMNHYTAEIDLISKVLAYLKLAYYRFIDVIAIRVEHSFQNQLREKIMGGFIERLFTGPGHEDTCRSYLEDDPEIAAKRAELNRQMEIVRVAEQELKKVLVRE